MYRFVTPPIATIYDGCGPTAATDGFTGFLRATILKTPDLRAYKVHKMIVRNEKVWVYMKNHLNGFVDELQQTLSANGYHADYGKKDDKPSVNVTFEGRVYRVITEWDNAPPTMFERFCDWIDHKIHPPRNFER